MDKWILVIGVFFADHDELHAKGSFSSEDNCQKFVAMVGVGMHVDWLGRCMSQTDFRRHYPTLKLDEDS
jgi:hypothetical protein